MPNANKCSVRTVYPSWLSIGKHNIKPNFKPHLQCRHHYSQLANFTRGMKELSYKNKTTDKNIILENNILINNNNHLVKNKRPIYIHRGQGK